MEDRAYQKVDGTGFTFDGVSYKGFSDDSRLPLGVRQQIARWAVAHRVANAEQKRLASDRPVPRQRSELLQIAESEDRLLDSAAFANALEQLTDDEQIRVLRPEAFLNSRKAWPLAPGAVEALFPNLTSNQLRDWDNHGLVPAYRLGPGRYRGYFRGQLVLALLIRKIIDAGWSVSRIQRELGNSPEPARETMESIKIFVAERNRLVPMARSRSTAARALAGVAK
jgi:DNA-binding transcriptional MerR regulator